MKSGIKPGGVVSKPRTSLVDGRNRAVQRFTARGLNVKSTPRVVQVVSRQLTVCNHTTTVSIHPELPTGLVFHFSIIQLRSRVWLDGAGAA